VKLIVGLGNPGAEYARTRHNAGFMALDRLAARHAPGEIARSRFGGLGVEARLARAGAGEERVLLLKPMGYMNRSGASVAEATRFYKLDPANDLLILVDDTALECGRIRLRAKGSDGGHNGLADIEQKLGMTEYARCRIGVDARGMADQVGHVLGRFTEEQLERVGPALEKAADAAQVWAWEGIDAAMNQFNVRPAREERPQADAGPGEKTNATEPGAGETGK
jgi:PTH1 family peptidyl-tRNA hydrolase